MSAGLLDPLGRVLRATREEAGVLQADISFKAGISRRVISRLEGGERWPEGGPDRIVAVYAAECGVEWLELWRRALELAGTQKGPPSPKR